MAVTGEKKRLGRPKGSRNLKEVDPPRPEVRVTVDHGVTRDSDAWLAIYNAALSGFLATSDTWTMVKAPGKPAERVSNIEEFTRLAGIAADAGLKEYRRRFR